MDNQLPLVSAIMLAGDTPITDIKQAITCFQQQTYPYKELIIINNAKSQLAASELNIDAQRDIFILDTPARLPAGLARNYGISGANGTILAQFDADWWYSPERLECQLAAMAQQTAHICMLARTIAFSHCTGLGTYYTNDRNTIYGTMVCIRPHGIDYPNYEKNEEFGFLDRMLQAGQKAITIDNPFLAIKRYTGFDCKKNELVANRLEESDAAVLQNRLALCRE